MVTKPNDMIDEIVRKLNQAELNPSPYAFQDIRLMLRDLRQVIDEHTDERIYVALAIAKVPEAV